jgi:hypothetical protein
MCTQPKGLQFNGGSRRILNKLEKTQTGEMVSSGPLGARPQIYGDKAKCG